MPKRKDIIDIYDSLRSPQSGLMRPALSPESREMQLESLAYDLAEKKLREGTASSQVIIHFLKNATAKAELEKAKVEYENELLKAKRDSIKQQAMNESLARDALNAFRKYAGQDDDTDEEDSY